MNKNTFLSIAFLFIAPISIAQVLYTEDFNSYPAAAHLNPDYTGSNAGQGDWVVSRSNNNSTVTAMVTPENGKGNVLTITKNDTSPTHILIRQKEGIFNNLWNSRIAGNNILKLEYEFYGLGSFIARGGIGQSDGILVNGLIFNSSNNKYEILASHLNSNILISILKQYNVNTFPYNMWIKTELFIDYNARKIYSYIPTLNLFRADDETTYLALDKIMFFVNSLEIGTVVKYDNIKLTALQSVPSYILNVNEFASSKFNVYPNPTTDIVNISNNDNLYVENITVYDVAGKQLNTQSFNNHAQIQLNVEHLASGTYMLHIQTSAGIAVKKMVKM